jgi:hypothetical protein
MSEWLLRLRAEYVEAVEAEAQAQERQADAAKMLARARAHRTTLSDAIAAIERLVDGTSGEEVPF